VQIALAVDPGSTDSFCWLVAAVRCFCPVRCLWDCEGSLMLLALDASGTPSLRLTVSLSAAMMVSTAPAEGDDSAPDSQHGGENDEDLG